MSTNGQYPSVLLQGVADQTLIDILKKRRISRVFVTEGRPSLEAAKKLCRQLLKQKIRPTLISDNMAGFLFYKRMLKEAWIAYQSVNRYGALCDTGALILGVLGRKHKVKINLVPAGIKRRLFGSNKDIMYFNKKRMAPNGIKVFVPLVELLPRKYITKVYA